jgi:hypothetical protein
MDSRIVSSSPFFLEEPLCRNFLAVGIFYARKLRVGTESCTNSRHQQVGTLGSHE